MQIRSFLEYEDKRAYCSRIKGAGYVSKSICHCSRLLAISYYANLKGLKVELGSDRLFGIPLDAYIPLGAGWPFKSNTDSEKIDILKEHLCKQRGIKLIKLPMKPNEAEPDYATAYQSSISERTYIYIFRHTRKMSRIIKENI